jgi:hypothetical protein
MHIVPKKALMDPLARLARGNCWVKPFAYAHGDPGTVYNVVHYQLYRPVVWSQASQPEENAIVSGPGGELMRVTRAITHIRLCDANHAKIEALDGLAAAYLRLCQAYTTYFCTEAEPDGYLAPCFESPLSQRWQRAAIQHAAGIAQSWRSNYATAVQEYLAALAAYEEDHEPDEAPPEWRDWNTPVLKEPVIQANANVALLQPSEDSSFDYRQQFRLLAHIPAQLAWGAAKRGIRARKVKSAYSSQECHCCHAVSRENRPNQQTFCCMVCGHTNHADVNAAENLASRLNDQELAACADRKAIKALLDRRHQDWQYIQRLDYGQPPAELSRQPA